LIQEDSERSYNQYSLFKISAATCHVSVFWRVHQDCRSAPNTLVLLGRPERSVSDGLLFYPWRFLFFIRHAFSEIPRPIALKLCHMIGIWLCFINWLQIFGMCSLQKIWGTKTSKISVNFGPLKTLIANISRTRQHIQNRKDVRTRKFPPAFDVKSPVNFGPLRLGITCEFGPTKMHFFGILYLGP